jgi:hypothetical protein
VHKARAEGIPADTPDEVCFEVVVDNAVVTFCGPLTLLLFDDGKNVMTYSYGTAKN